MEYSAVSVNTVVIRTIDKGRNQFFAVTKYRCSEEFVKGYVGGLVGAVEKATAVTIARSWATTSLTVSAIDCYAGGIVGFLRTNRLRNNYAK